MAEDKLKVLLDAEQAPKPRAGVVVRDQLTVAASEGSATSYGVWLEPYSKTLMLEPKQFAEDFYLDSSVPRFPKSEWQLTDSHWDDVVREEDRWLLSDGSDEQIYTNKVFDGNTGFCVDFFLFAPETDSFLALQLLFGQWQLDVYSSGEGKLYVQGESTPRAAGWLVSRHGTTLCERRSRLIIVPSANRTLVIRRNQIAGFYYTIPESEWDSETEEVIESGRDFQLKAPGCKVQFQLTELAYPTDATDRYWISPNRQLPKPPLVGQTFEVEPDWLNLGGAISCGVYAGLGDGEGFADLALFSADGTADTYCVAATFAAGYNGRVSPFLRGATVSMDPLAPDVAMEPGEISDDVTAATISVSDDPWQTSATLKLRLPEDHPILGKCNRRCVLKIGDTVILDGVLAEPPKLVYDRNAAACYELQVASLLKFGDQPCLHSSVQFDGADHTDAMKWLFKFACIPSDLLEMDADDTPLRDSRSGTALENSELRPEIADTPRQWMERICEESRWVLYDGPLASGDFGFLYKDPLGFDTTPTHTFYVQSADAGTDGSYDRIHDSLTLYDIEPEANELHVVGCNEYGQLIDCKYVDAASQDPDTAEASRPANWLGFRKIAVIPVPGFVPEWLLKRLALRIGRELSKTVRMVEFEADWKVGLWRNKVVTIDVGDSGIEGAGDYRIETMDVEFRDESGDYPIRRGRYTAVKIDADYASQARKRGDQRLLQQIGYYLRFGPQVKAIQAVQQTDLPGQKDRSNVLACQGPIARVVSVVDDNGLEEFVLGCNGMDATTIVR